MSNFLRGTNPKKYAEDLEFLGGLLVIGIGLPILVVKAIKKAVQKAKG